MSIFTFRVADGASLNSLGRAHGVTRFRWLTHPELVEQVCMRCLWYHDTVWNQGDPSAPEPPLHDYCACVTEPEFDEGSILGMDPDGEQILASDAPELQPGEYLAQQLDRMNDRRKVALMGKERTTLYKAKLITAKDLVSWQRGVRPVKDLARRLGIEHEAISAAAKELDSARLLATAEKRIGLRKLRLQQKRWTTYRKQALQVTAADVDRINPGKFVVSG